MTATTVDAAFVDLVDRALGQQEVAERGGVVHPIRMIPIDLIAEALVREMRETGASARQAFAAVLRRYDPPSAVIDRSTFP